MWYLDRKNKKERRTPKAPSVKEIENVFFCGMQNGCSLDRIGELVRNMPGYRLVSSRFGDWKVSDMWIAKSPSIHSAGTTTIFFRNAPVWVMSYEGWYQKEAIPLLQHVLLHAYSHSEFYGCRGQTAFQEPFGGQVYKNIWEGTFAHFSGTEKIVSGNGVTSELLGTYSYRGGIL